MYLLMIRSKNNSFYEGTNRCNNLIIYYLNVTSLPVIQASLYFCIYGY